MPKSIKKKPLVSLIGREIKKPETKTKSALGRMSKRKGANYERKIAKVFSSKFGTEFIRTPASGGFAKGMAGTDGFRGDIRPADGRKFGIHCELKNQQTWKLREWYRQSESDCPDYSRPVVVFHEQNSSRDFVMISLDDFLELIDVKKVTK